MERYLGGDVPAASVTFAVLNETGKQLRRDVVETNRKALIGYLRGVMSLAGVLASLRDRDWARPRMGLGG